MTFSLLEKLMGIHETVKHVLAEDFKGDVRLHAAGLLEDAGLPCVSFQRPCPPRHLDKS
jgi:hypothetical protein